MSYAPPAEVTRPKSNAPSTTTINDQANAALAHARDLGIARDNAARRASKARAAYIEAEEAHENAKREATRLTEIARTEHYRNNPYAR